MGRSPLKTDRHYGRDQGLGLAAILQALAETLSGLADFGIGEPEPLSREEREREGPVAQQREGEGAFESLARPSRTLTRRVLRPRHPLPLPWERESQVGFSRLRTPRS